VATQPPIIPFNENACLLKIAMLAELLQ
jgi:hypothetical protein